MIFASDYVRLIQNLTVMNNKSIPHLYSSHQKGFTLIELLTVIGVLGILAGFLITNVSGARLRAKDAKKKAELNSLKTALQLYYNKYQKYPEPAHIPTKILGCGPNGTDQCPYSGCSAYFAAGGADGCETVFLQTYNATTTSKYYRCNDDNDYRLKDTLSNASDPDIADSQLRCPVCGTTYIGNQYVVCPD